MAVNPYRALELLLTLTAPCGTESIPLATAVGRILARPIVADRDLPPLNRSAMDGYACRAADTQFPTLLPIVATLAAGDPVTHVLAPGTCARIYTGAVIPCGADCVAMQEVATPVGSDRVTIGVPQRVGQNILQRGEDALAGTVLLPAGTRLDAAAIAVLATVGCDPVPVIRAPVVHVLTTGSELQPATAAVEAHQVRESNGQAVAALIAAFSPAQVLVGTPTPDDPTVLRARLEAALGEADAVITTGGASVGPRDHVKQVLQAMGATLHFERLAIKPGKPVICAQLGDQLVLGLPGSPLACLTAARLLAVPLARALSGIADHSGPTLPVRMALPLTHQPGRLRFALVRLQVAPDATLVATPVHTHSVADLAAAAQADGMVAIPAHWPAVPAGAILQCWLWRPWSG